MKYQLIPIAGALILMLSACGPTAHIQKDAKTDFTRYKTYAWIEKGEKGKKGLTTANNLLEQKMRSAVNDEVQKTTGWKEVKRKPDVLLTYNVVVQKTIQQRSDPVYANPYFQTYYSPFRRRYYDVYYPSQFIGYNDYSVPVKEGTITVSIVDAKKGKTVWQGWTSDEVNSNNLTDKEVESSVKAIFKKFEVK